MAESDLSRWESLAEGTARVVRGTAAGFLAGMVASWVTDQYKAVESRPVNVRRAEEAERASAPWTNKTVAYATGNGDSTAVKVAEVVSRELFEHELSADEKKIAGPAVHYASGGAVGAVYGGLSELIPNVGIGLGVPYATLLWLGRDQVAAPAMGLTKPAAETTAEDRASGLASHFVYGITLDISRRILRRLL